MLIKSTEKANECQLKKKLAQRYSAPRSRAWFMVQLYGGLTILTPARMVSICIPVMPIFIPLFPAFFSLHPLLPLQPHLSGSSFLRRTTLYPSNVN